jgi:hypothetical protein
MRHLLLVGSCLALALLSLAALPGPAGLNLTRLVGTLGEEAERHERLEEQTEAVLRRTGAKTEVAEEVAAGRLGLFAAAARFRDLDADTSADYRQHWRLLVEGATDEERYCRQVLSYAALPLREQGDGPAALDRLRAQLDEALAGGGVRLPPPGDGRP